jgi:hypothetical protein
MTTGTARKFWSLDGFVAIIFTIFTISALLRGSILGAMLMGIFSYWWIKRVLAKPTIIRRRGGYSQNHGPRDLDL